MIKLLRAFDGRILAYDPFPNPAATALGVEYVELETLLRESDLISLHCPLMASTHHLMNEER
jgi:D-lactate dehydrogenase